MTRAPVRLMEGEECTDLRVTVAGYDRAPTGDSGLRYTTMVTDNGPAATYVLSHDNGLKGTLVCLSCRRHADEG